MGKRSVTYILPGPEGTGFWEVSRSNRDAKRKSRNTKAASVFCFGGGDLYAVPLWVRTTDPEVMLGTVKTQLESRGLGRFPPPPARTFDVLEVDRIDGNTQALAIVLANDRQEYLDFSNLLGFDISPKLYRFSENGAAIWKENEKYIFAVNKNGNLAYFQALSSAAPDEDMISELFCVKSWLEGARFTGRIDSILLFDEIPGSWFISNAERVLGIPVKPAGPALPAVNTSPTRLFPVAHAERERRNRIRQKWLNALTVGLLIYLAISAFVLFNIVKTERKLAAKKNWITSYKPESDQVRSIKERWDFLQPAIDKSYFPLENFKRVVEALPGEDVRLTVFQTDHQKISMEGEASNVNAALDWRKTLSSDERFAGYVWRFPQPKIKGGKATFEAEGERQQW